MRHTIRRKGMSQGFEWILVIVGFVVFILWIGRLIDPCSTAKAKTVVTKATLHSLAAAVQQFKTDTGRFPSREVGLIELVQQPADTPGWRSDGYLEMIELPRDAWKNDFIYVLKPESASPFVIISFGADGNPGGTGNNADLYSTDLQ